MRALQFDYHSWLRYLVLHYPEASPMDVRKRSVEKLELILQDLLRINAVAPVAEECQFQRWLDLAISETRTQIDRARTKTVH
jgi:hypothetical protein